jgi:parallel beta-helix repeat protein
MKKTRITMQLTPVFLFLITASFVIGVNAQTQFSGAITIDSDGSITPSSAPIQQEGNTYKLLDSFMGNITIKTDNAVLDGQGHTVGSVITGLETTNGVDILYSSNVTITNLQITGFVQAIHLLNSTNCSITGNNITANIDGIRMENSSGNLITNNNFTENRHGIHPYQENIFYHNNFVNSTDRDVYLDSPDHIDTWDNGYPSGGNYWSNYTGVDEKKGSSQSDAGGDGIGDTPQILSSNNMDRYPLMVPYVYAPQPTSQLDLLWVYVAIVVVVAIAVITAFLFFRRRAVPKKQ